MKRRKRCAECNELFSPRPQLKEQSYCSNRECQSGRKWKWQRSRREQDGDYQANEADARKAWAEKNPGYWQGYREKNPKYAERNRAQQRERNQRRGGRQGVKTKTRLEEANRGWSLMEWGGKKYAVVEIGGRDVGKGKSLVDRGWTAFTSHGVVDKNEDVCLGVKPWETREKGQISMTEKGLQMRTRESPKALGDRG